MAGRPDDLDGSATLVVLEIVLGIDNLVFIAIPADKRPPEQRDRARVIALLLALVMRLILLVGGMFLLFKATMALTSGSRAGTARAGRSGSTPRSAWC